jgi:hypothetical protein
MSETYFDKYFWQGVVQGVFFTLVAFFSGYGVMAAIRDGFL